jgi:hypothetical protein
MKLNIIIYAYRGFLSTILFIIGKKSKIKELFAMDEEDRSVNLDMASLSSGSSANGESFVDANASTEAMMYEHLHQAKQKFRYVATDLKGKKIKGTFDAYNIDQAKKFLTDEGLNILTINLNSPYFKYIGHKNKLNDTDLEYEVLVEDM